MAAVHRVMEELVVHLKVVSVGAGDVEARVLLVPPHRLYPLFVLEVAGDIEEDLFLLHGALSVLVSTLLDFEGVKLLVLQL